MRKICFLVICSFCLVGCSVNEKEPLQPTQIVDGKSIVMPPEFYVLPKARVEQPNESESTEI